MSLDLEIIDRDLQRLEENVRATLARIRNLKAMRQHLIRTEQEAK